MERRPVYCVSNTGRRADERECLKSVAARPPAERACNIAFCPVPFFRVSDWGLCERPCGRGVRYRSVECVLEMSSNETLSDELCLQALEVADVAVPDYLDEGAGGSGGDALVPLAPIAAPEPPIDEEACNPQPCIEEAAVWRAGEWGVCSRDCVGMQQRPVRCENAVTGAPLPPEVCDVHGLRPPGERTCDGTPYACSVCATYGCFSGRGICAAEPGVDRCECEEGFLPPLCAAPRACASGVVGAGGECCAGARDEAVLTSRGECCAHPPDPEWWERDTVAPAPSWRPALDGLGECCLAGAGAVDVCGICEGVGVTIDALGACCNGVLDAGGMCCPSKVLDECGVCEGDGGSCATIVERVGVAVPPDWAMGVLRVAALDSLDYDYGTDLTVAAEQLHVSLLRNLTAFALRLPQSHVLLSNTSYEGDTMYADVMVLSAWALSPRFEALVYGDAEEEDLAGPNASAPAPRPPPVDAFDPLAPLAPPPPSELEVFAQLDAVPPPSGRAGYDADGRIIAALPPHNASAVGAVGAAGAGASSTAMLGWSGYESADWARSAVRQKELSVSNVAAAISAAAVDWSVVRSGYDPESPRLVAWVLGPLMNVSRVGTCGNGVCETGEVCPDGAAQRANRGDHRRGDGDGSSVWEYLPHGWCCAEDCPLLTLECPNGDSSRECSGHGRCRRSNGRCECFAGYSGETCDECAEGWFRKNGVCHAIPMLSSPPPPSPPPPPPSPPLEIVPDSELSESAAWGVGVLVAVAAAGVCALAALSQAAKSLFAWHRRRTRLARKYRHGALKSGMLTRPQRAQRFGEAPPYGRPARPTHAWHDEFDCGECDAAFAGFTAGGGYDAERATEATEVTAQTALPEKREAHVAPMVREDESGRWVRTAEGPWRRVELETRKRRAVKGTLRGTMGLGIADGGSGAVPASAPSLLPLADGGQPPAFPSEDAMEASEPETREPPPAIPRQPKWARVSQPDKPRTELAALRAAQEQHEKHEGYLALREEAVRRQVASLPEAWTDREAERIQGEKERERHEAAPQAEQDQLDAYC